MSKAVVINTNSIINRLRQLGAASKAKFEEISKSLNVRLNHKGGLEEIPLVPLNSGITPSVVFPVLFDIPVPLNYTRTLPLRHKSPAYMLNRASSSILPDENKVPTPEARTIECEELGLNQDTLQLQEFLLFLEETGLGVVEMKALPSGVTRISVEDLIGPQSVMEREPARVRG